MKAVNLKPETAQKVGKLANRFWLAGILFSIAHGVVKVRAHLAALLTDAHATTDGKTC